MVIMTINRDCKATFRNWGPHFARVLALPLLIGMPLPSKSKAATEFGHIWPCCL